MGLRKRIICLGVSIFFAVSIFTGCDETVKNTGDKTAETIKGETQLTSKEVFNILNEDIEGDVIYQDIKFLASKECDGRLPGTEGNELATEFIENEFKVIGLETFGELEGYRHTYEQWVPYVNELPTMELVDSEGTVLESFVYLDDFAAEANFFYKKQGEILGEVVYYTDGKSVMEDKENLEGKIVIGPGNAIYGVNYGGTNFFQDAGVKGVIYISDRSEGKDETLMKRVSYEQGIPKFRSEERPLFAVCDEKASEEIIEKSKDGVKLRLKINNSVKRKEVSNVVGMIPGVDPEYKDEYLFITGHFDHLGNNHDGTYNPGASDNASGVATLLEIARSIKENDIKPQKNIVFVAFNGEENGLVGSQHFCESIDINFKNSIVLNIDMIANVAKGPLYISSVKRSRLSKEVQKIAEEMGLKTKMEYGVYYSDHASFEEKGATAVTFVEAEQDEYHTPADTIDVIDKEDLEDVVELILRYISHQVF